MKRIKEPLGFDTLTLIKQVEELIWMAKKIKLEHIWIRHYSPFLSRHLKRLNFKITVRSFIDPGTGNKYRHTKISWEHMTWTTE